MRAAPGARGAEERGYLPPGPAGEREAGGAGAFGHLWRPLVLPLDVSVSHPRRELAPVVFRVVELVPWRRGFGAGSPAQEVEAVHVGPWDAEGQVHGVNRTGKEHAAGCYHGVEVVILFC